MGVGVGLRWGGCLRRGDRLSLRTHVRMGSRRYRAEETVQQGCRLLSSERPALKVGLWNLGTGISSGFSPFPESIRVAHCNSVVFVNTLMYVEHRLSFREPGILARARQRVPMGPVPPRETLSATSLMNFPGRQHFTCAL